MNQKSSISNKNLMNTPPKKELLFIVKNILAKENIPFGSSPPVHNFNYKQLLSFISKKIITENKYENYKMTQFSESNQDSDHIFEMDL